MKKSAIIIGAGYGGMALANILGKAGYRVTVHEKNTHLGGRISAIKQDGYTFDLGPSWYLMPEIFEQYYQLFGESAASRLELQRLSPGYKVFFEHHSPLIIQGDLKKDYDVFEQIEQGAGKKLMRYVAKSSRVYNIAVQHFLYNNFLRLRDFITYDVIVGGVSMLRLVAKPLDAYVRTIFCDQRLKQILEYHMVFLGSSPFQAPALYTLMSHLDFKSGVFYPRRGMLYLANDMKLLGAKYDITYHTGSPVAKIMVKNGTAVGIQLKDGKKVYADIVISNADLEFTETKLLAPEHQSFPHRYWQLKQPGPGALLISIGVRGTLPQLLHHNLYFVDDWRGNFKDIYEDKKIPKSASLYVCNPTKSDPSYAPANCENLFILAPIPAGVSLQNSEQTALADKMIAAFAKAINEPDLAARITTRHIFGPADFKHKYNAWQYNAFGGESHLLRQSVLFRTPNKSKKVKNLYYVGAGTLPGIGLPMCLIGAQLTYKRIIGATTPGPVDSGEL